MGVGLWPLVLTFGLLSPSSGGVSGGRGSSDRADVLVGSAVSLLCCALLPVCTSELCWTLGGASGALQVVAQVPEAVQ